ncbi:serine/threonine-protein kinase Nek2-like isoform X2 [Watersipora subatra]|uniref:serine/threonine-protein kinase Nek2-like isoform X2 n=1 Tax=Watersipora subatra TaxID=2589382 RepID=UPI00355C547E
MDRYTQIKEIGKGAYGRAILVEAKATKEKLVVKEMDLTKLPIESQEACRGEVKLLSRLQHRNVVRYHDSFEERRKLYIVMEYCDGGDLEEKINPPNPLQPRLTEKEIWDYFVQICLALKYIHSKKVLHRDLKPSNVFLTKKGEVKLGDFGVSRTLKYTMELATTFAGTPVYLSPEVVDSKPYNDKSDVWSLGCILYEMATGDLPFDATNILTLCRQIMNAPHRQLPSSFSSEMRQLVNDMLTKSPSQRPSISQILQKPVVRTVARRFLSDREATKGVPINSPAGPPKSIAQHIDSLQVYRQLQAPVQQLMKPAEPVKQPAEPVKQPAEPARQPVMPARQPAMPARQPAASVRQPAEPGRIPVRVPLDHVQLFRLAPPRKAPAEAPKPNRMPKPISPAYRDDPRAGPDPSPQLKTNAPVKREKSLYEELLELGDDFDINNLDVSGERWFKDEIDAAAQAKLPNGNEGNPDVLPSYDQLATELQLNPAPKPDRRPDPNATIVPRPAGSATRDDTDTLSPQSVKKLKDELLALDLTKIRLESIPGLKDLEEDDGPDNFASLFSLPPPDWKDKDMSLYDELLALELHNRELKLAGLN